MRYTFSKKEKLKNKILLNKLFSEGSSFVIPPYRVLYIQSEELELPAELQFAVSIPKKKVRVSPKRNLLKRRTREAFRLQKNRLTDQLTKNNNQLAVFFIYLDHKIHPYSVVEESMEKCIQKLLEA